MRKCTAVLLLCSLLAAGDTPLADAGAFETAFSASARVRLVAVVSPT